MPICQMGGLSPPQIMLRCFKKKYGERLSDFTDNLPAPQPHKKESPPKLQRAAQCGKPVGSLGGQPTHPGTVRHGRPPPRPAAVAARHTWRRSCFPPWGAEGARRPGQAPGPLGLGHSRPSPLFLLFPASCLRHCLPSSALSTHTPHRTKQWGPIGVTKTKNKLTSTRVTFWETSDSFSAGRPLSKKKQLLRAMKNPQKRWQRMELFGQK